MQDHMIVLFKLMHQLIEEILVVHLFNLEGEVLGINTAIFSPTGGSVGIGFSIPSNLAQPIIEQLKKFGKTQRGWLGVRIQEVTA